MRVFAAGAGAAIGTRLVPQRSSARYLRREGMVVLSARQRADARFGDEFRRARESCRETETCLRPSEEG